MEKVIEVLNRMQADGVIERFAIGGGIATIYYLEPYQTDDIDVFFLPVGLGDSGLVTLEPIYSYLGQPRVLSCQGGYIDRELAGAICRSF